MRVMRLLCDKCKHMLKYHSSMSSNDNLDVLVGLCSECQKTIAEKRKELNNGKETSKTDKERGAQTKTS